MRNRLIQDGQTSLLTCLIGGDSEERGNFETHLACESGKLASIRRTTFQRQHITLGPLNLSHKLGDILSSCAGESLGDIDELK